MHRYLLGYTHKYASLLLHEVTGGPLNSTKQGTHDIKLRMAKMKQPVTLNYKWIFQQFDNRPNMQQELMKNFTQV